MTVRTKFLLSLPITASDIEFLRNPEITVEIDRDIKKIDFNYGENVQYVASHSKVLITALDEKEELMLKLRFGDRFQVIEKYYIS